MITDNKIKEIKSILKNQLNIILIRELSKIDYRKFIYEFFSMLNEYKNFVLKMVDIEDVVNNIFTDQSKYYRRVKMLLSFSFLLGYSFGRIYEKVGKTVFSYSVML